MLRPVEGAGREYEYRRLSVLGAAGGRAAECRLCPRRGPAAIHRPPGRIFKEYPHPQARHGLQPGGAGGAAVCRRVCPPQPGGWPGANSASGATLWTSTRRTCANPPVWSTGMTRSTRWHRSTCSPSAGTARWKRSISPPPARCCSATRYETAEALRDAWKKARGKHRAALEKAMEADLAQLDSGLMPEAMDKYYGLRYAVPRHPAGPPRPAPSLCWMR